MWQRRNKFNSCRSKGLDGYNYASKLEAAVANKFYNNKENIILDRQIKFNFFADSNNILFTSPFSKVKGSEKLLGYIPDFFVEDTNTKEQYYVEAKGDTNTQDWKRKVKYWILCCDKKLLVYSGSYKNPKVTSTIIPKNYK